MMIRKIFFAVILLSFGSIGASGMAFSNFSFTDNRDVNTLINNVIGDAILNGDSMPEDRSRSIGQGICRVAGIGSSCSNVANLGQGICLASGAGSACNGARKLGQGVCFAAGGGDDCRFAKTIGQAICYAGLANNPRINSSECFYVK